MKRVTLTQKATIKAKFLEHYANAVSELRYESLYELLIAVILSAQCTDKRVNLITPALFAKYPNIEALANSDLDDLKSLIQSCSFFNNKARNLIWRRNSFRKNPISKTCGSWAKNG